MKTLCPLTLLLMLAACEDPPNYQYATNWDTMNYAAMVCQDTSNKPGCITSDDELADIGRRGKGK